jgi:hypothetical protein
VLTSKHHLNVLSRHERHFLARARAQLAAEGTRTSSLEGTPCRWLYELHCTAPGQEKIVVSISTGTVLRAGQAGFKGRGREHRRGTELVDFLNNSLADEFKWPFHFTSGVEKLFCREFRNAKGRQRGKSGESRFSMAPCCCMLTSFSPGRNYTAFLAKPVTFHLDHTQVSMKSTFAPIPAPPPPVSLLL